MVSPRRSQSPVIVQAAIPGYRALFFAELKAAVPELTIAAGESHFEPSVTTDSRAKVNIDHALRNRYLLGRRILFQHGHHKAVRGAGVVVLELNPRVLNTWLTLIEARLRNRRALLWGHHLGRSLGEVRPGFARRLQARLAKGLIAYTYEDAAAMAREYPRQQIFIAPNSTERRTDVELIDGGPRTDFLYVGRLTEPKRPRLLLDGFTRACRAALLPDSTRLVLIGDGPLRSGLLDTVAGTGLEHRIVVAPATFGSDELNRYYSTAVAGVCGGYVGLNITQSLSRGVPFVFALNANHSPEVVLANAGINAFTFEPATADQVAQAYAAAWEADQSGKVDRYEIQRSLMSAYCVELMVEGFVEALRGRQ
jgi:glycosyltransferase involved in cell wall biosynthesis